MKQMSRRKFLQLSALAGGALMLPAPVHWLGRREAFAYSQSPATIQLFGTQLRSVGPGGIPVAASDSFSAPVTGVTHYTIDVGEYRDQICPSLGPTTLWGFNPANPLGGGSQPQRHLGGIIVGEKDVPIQITFRNKLRTTGKHILPNDLSIMGAGDGFNRLSIHFHGGLVPWISDGGPYAWFDPAGRRGMSFMNNQVLNPSAGLNEAEYYYPLRQSARFGWYHDHAIGITRINAYAGIASALLIRDNFERNLQNLGLPPFIESSVVEGTAVLELPLIIQDKIFVGPATAAMDPTWTNAVDPQATAPGSLWYAHIYERQRWRLSGSAKGGNANSPLLPDPSAIPEFFGDTMLVNGTAFPTATVEPRRYRLRFLNACNARFLNLQFYVDDGSQNGITLNPLTGNPVNAPFTSDLYAGATAPSGYAPGAHVLQIGTEGGFLARPTLMPVNVPFNPITMTGSLVVAPAERPDIIIDFSKHAGKSIILYNDAPAPFPMGDPRNDYFPGWNVKGNPLNALTPNGFGPNSRVLMKFVVSGAASSADRPLAIGTNTDLSSGNEPLLMPEGVSTPPPGVPVRVLTLNEAFDAYGRLIQMLGTNTPMMTSSTGFGRAYMDTATEVVQNGATEVWEIYNTTADVHPMHFHLVNVQVINRQPFQVNSLFPKGTAKFTGPVTPPEANERGWKETVQMFPGTVTRIIMKFTLPGIITSTGALIPTPPSPRTGGNEYVWHCHILEHEEHDMMRPLIVT